MTLTKSSVWAPYEVRSNSPSRRVQVAIVSKDEIAPDAAFARSRTWIRVPVGVAAFHDGTSWVNACAGVAQAEVQRDVCQDLPPSDFVPIGVPITSSPSTTVVPSCVPASKPAAPFQLVYVCWAVVPAARFASLVSTPRWCMPTPIGTPSRTSPITTATRRGWRMESQ